MKIYRAIDEFEYENYFKNKRFENRISFMSVNFSTFTFTPYEQFSSFFFLTLKDAIDFGLNNLLDFYILEMDLPKRTITKCLGVGLYEECDKKIKFEALIPIKKLNARLSSMKVFARIINGEKMSENVDYSNSLCYKFLEFYKVNLTPHKNLVNETYHTLSGNVFEQDATFNRMILDELSVCD